MVVGSVTIPEEAIAQFCHRWKVVRLELFGSALNGEFRADSDVDLMATFAPDAAWSLFDHIDMVSELKQVFGREVDLVTRCTIEKSPNWVRRKHILEHAEVIYES